MLFCAMSCTTCTAFAIEKVAHLLREPPPRACRVAPKYPANNRQQYEDERREREHRVVSERSPELRRFILQPFGDRHFEKL